MLRHDAAAVVEHDEPERATQHDHGLILGRLSVLMRLHVGIGLDCIEQPVARVVGAGMKIMVLASARACPRLRAASVEQGLVNEFNRGHGRGLELS